MEKMKKLLAAAMTLLMVFCAATAFAAAPGTPQVLHLEECDADCPFDTYHATENIDGVHHDFVVYCFNSGKHWPNDSNDNAMSELFVPDEMIHLSDEIKDKIYRIMYAGYPEDNLGLIENAGDVWHDYEWINEHAATPSNYVLDLFPQLVGFDFSLTDDPANYGVQNENSAAFAALAEAADTLGNWSYSTSAEEYQKYQDFVEKELYFFAFMDAVCMTVRFGEPEVENIEVWFDGYVNHHGHYATQVAIWRILYENQVPGNPNSQSVAMGEDTLVRQLVDFANGVGTYAGVKVPPRTTTFSDMERYRDNLFENGKVLLREDNTPVGKDGVIAFTLQDDGTFKSEPLHFDPETAYEMPYHINFTSGGTMGADLVQHGDGSTFCIVAEDVADDATGKISVALDAHWPSEVYQYVRSTQQSLSVADRTTQEMSGCFFNTVPMELTLRAKVVEKPGPDIPTTGDNTSILFLLAMLVFSLTGLTVLKNRC